MNDVELERRRIREAVESLPPMASQFAFRQRVLEAIDPTTVERRAGLSGGPEAATRAEGTPTRLSTAAGIALNETG